MQYGRLHLVGDAAHIVPPTGAKGLNLAASDVGLLYNLLCKAYLQNQPDVMQSYSELALKRVWQTERFSWWMSNMLHDYRDDKSSATDALTFERFMNAELEFYMTREDGLRIVAEQYVGLPFTQI